MQRLKIIKCKTCKKKFTPKSHRNKFCCRACFKKDFSERVKKESPRGFPCFDCPVCGQRIKLDFDPILNSTKWLSFSCPGCNMLMINVYEFITTEDETNN